MAFTNQAQMSAWLTLVLLANALFLVVMVLRVLRTHSSKALRVIRIVQRRCGIPDPDDSPRASRSGAGAGAGSSGPCGCPWPCCRRKLEPSVTQRLLQRT